METVDQTLVTACRSRGLRVTPQRIAVYRVVVGSTAHPAVETIWREVRRVLPAISLDTVYRTLDSLMELGLVTRLGALDKNRFDGVTAAHDHFICTKCGRITDVACLHPENLPEWDSAVGEVKSATFLLWGICRNCRDGGNGRKNEASGKVDEAAVDRKK